MIRLFLAPLFFLLAGGKAFTSAVGVAVCFFTRGRGHWAEAKETTRGDPGARHCGPRKFWPERYGRVLLALIYNPISEQSTLLPQRLKSDLL